MIVTDNLLKYLALINCYPEDAMEAWKLYEEEMKGEIIKKKEDAVEVKKRKEFETKLEKTSSIPVSINSMERYNPADHNKYSVYTLYKGETLLYQTGYNYLDYDINYMDAVRRGEFLGDGGFNASLKEEFKKKECIANFARWAKYFDIVYYRSISLTDLHKAAYVCTMYTTEGRRHGRLIKKKKTGAYMLLCNGHELPVDEKRLYIHPIVNEEVLEELVRDGVKYDNVYIVEPDKQDFGPFKKQLPYLKACCEEKATVVLLSKKARESSGKRFRNIQYRSHPEPKRVSFR
jgi:hypothetical protein